MIDFKTYEELDEIRVPGKAIAFQSDVQINK